MTRTPFQRPARPGATEQPSAEAALPRDVEDALDIALMETFPASDPVALSIQPAIRPPADRR